MCLVLTCTNETMQFKNRHNNNNIGQIKSLSLYLFSTLWTGFSGSCLKPPDKTDRAMQSKLITLFYHMHLKKTHNKTHNNVPFMVESVSTVDGCNISGVIKEVGANCALCSDRHL